MDDAFDTVRNQRVCAANASVSRFPGRYICPVCQTEVYYASGDYVSPHFRHLPGTDHEECERYCQNFHIEVPLSRHEYEHLDAVLVAQASASQGRPFVSLAVRFRPAYTVDSVSFISGQISTPYTIHPNVRQQYFRISEAHESYLVKAHLADGECEVHIVDGFGGAAAVFRANDREAVRLPSHRILRPGGYLVVSKQPLQHQFHASLAPETIQTISGLHATSIKIPEDPNWQVRSNLQSLLGFETTAAIAAYAFLEPMAVSELATDCWEVAKNENVAVLIRLSIQLSPKPTRLLVQQRRSGHLLTEYLSLSGVSDELVIRADSTPESPDLYRIGLADPSRFLFEIGRSSEPIEPQCARLAFQFTTKSKSRRSLFWASHELSKELVDVSRGAVELISIKAPKSVEISVSDRSGQRAIIPEIGAERQLTNFLRRARFPCALSATGYPTLTLRRERMAIRRLPASTVPSANVVARSRREARLLDAFSRGRISRYAVRSLV